jgi:hypothetical protein
VPGHPFATQRSRELATEKQAVVGRGDERDHGQLPHGHAGLSITGSNVARRAGQVPSEPDGTAGGGIEPSAWPRALAQISIAPCATARVTKCASPLRGGCEARAALLRQIAMPAVLKRSARSRQEPRDVSTMCGNGKRSNVRRRKATLLA